MKRIIVSKTGEIYVRNIIFGVVFGPRIESAAREKNTGNAVDDLFGNHSGSNGGEIGGVISRSPG